MGAWDAGSSRAWRRLRLEVITRDRTQNDPNTGRPWLCRAHDEGWCSRAGAPPHACEGVMQHAHHTLGRARTGDDPRHIVGACEPCNLAIGDPTRGDPIAVPVTQW